MGLMLQKPQGVAGSTAPAILVGLFVAFGGVLYGYASPAFVFSGILLTHTDMIPVPSEVSLECTTGVSSSVLAMSTARTTC
jgi:hypothetical protein